jgi:hypothetical protein
MPGCVLQLPMGCQFRGDSSRDLLRLRRFESSQSLPAALLEGALERFEVHDLRGRGDLPGVMKLVREQRDQLVL